MKLKVVVIALLFIASCTSPVVMNYPSVCPDNNNKCQRNLDAQTLAIIGQPEAAEKLMRSDPSVDSVFINPCESK